MRVCESTSDLCRMIRAIVDESIRRREERLTYNQASRIDSPAYMPLSPHSHPACYGGHVFVSQLYRHVCACVSHSGQDTWLRSAGEFASQAAFLGCFPQINYWTASLMLSSLPLRQLLSTPAPALISLFPSLPRYVNEYRVVARGNAADMSHAASKQRMACGLRAPLLTDVAGA